MNQPPKKTSEEDDFVRQAEEHAPGIFGEFLDFLVNNQAWWLTPIIVVMLLLGALIWLASTGAAPFIYTIA